MIAVISDIHGNWPAFKSVLADIEHRGCSSIVSLGDIAGYYCLINECIEACRERNIVNIMGNHDDYLVHNRQCPRSYSANLCLDYQRKHITEQNLAWLATSVPFIDTDRMSLRHGGWNDLLDEYVTSQEIGFMLNKCQPLFASGHTHIQQRITAYGKSYFNPGSVGQPRDGCELAAYAIIDNNNEVSLFRCAYDIVEMQSVMRREGFPDRISLCLSAGLRIGQNELEKG